MREKDTHTHTHLYNSLNNERSLEAKKLTISAAKSFFLQCLSHLKQVSTNVIKSKPLSGNEYVSIIFRLILLPGSDFKSLELFSQLLSILQLRVLGNICLGLYERGTIKIYLLSVVYFKK